MPIKKEDLPQEIQDKVYHKPAHEGACITEQPVCKPDPRVTAQLTDEPATELVKPWRIVNAHKGDLFLSPGGPAGLIGGLLKQLDDPQFYSHMGIMTEDEVEVRHATGSSDRTTHDQFTTGILLGNPAPTDGYKEEAIKFQWPGTVTQSIENAFLTWRDQPLELDAQGNPQKYPSGREKPHPNFSLLDAVTNERYHINALSFAPEMMQVRGQWRAVWPVVVKPCPDLETNEVRRALHRIADAAKDVRGHYRLFCYTRGAIARDPDRAGPPVRLPQEEKRRDPAAGCTGADPVLIPVEATVPLVCSTFIWWAVQEANRAGGPRIALDLRPLDRRRRDEPTSACAHSPLLFLPPRPNDVRVDPAEDGLYRYTAGERVRAGLWLHDDYTVPLVRSKVSGALPAAKRIGLATLIHLVGNMPLGPLAELLGISMLTLNELILWLTDMADDVANQLCNTFASDKADTDSEDWRKPDEGLTVSPDDILNEWAPPQWADAEEIRGVYGYNERMILRPPEGVRRPPPPSRWEISQGSAKVFRGRVFFRDGQGQPVGVCGAHVRIGCHRWITGADGSYYAEGAPTGLYWGEASWTHPQTGLHLQSEGRRVEVGFGGPDDGDFELRFPPDTRRQVIVRGKMDLVNRHIIGKDWWSHPEYVSRPRLPGYRLLSTTEHSGIPGTAPGLLETDRPSRQACRRLGPRPGRVRLRDPAEQGRQGHLPRSAP